MHAALQLDHTLTGQRCQQNPYTGVDEDDEIDIRFEGYVDAPNVSGRIYLKIQAPNSFEWVLWRTFNVNEDAEENVYTRTIPAIQIDGSETRDFVDSTGQIDVRIEMTRAYPPVGGSLTTRIDYVEVVVVDN